MWKRSTDITFHFILLLSKRKCSSLYQCQLLTTAFYTYLLVRPDKVGCAHAYQYYGYPGHVEPERKCNETHYPDICSFQVTDSGDHKLTCDAKVCEPSRPEIGSINPEVGKITNWEASTTGTITATVEEAVKTNRRNGFGFLFIKCGDILQALTFPPKLKKIQDGGIRSNININIITLDSISRPHFYRILPKTSAALRKVLHDPNIDATAMDFELFQSVGQQTFDNLRPFFSGVMKGELCNKEMNQPAVCRMIYLIVGSRDGAVVRVLTSHQCGPVSIPARCLMWVEFLSVFTLIRGFSLGLSSSHLQIPIRPE